MGDHDILSHPLARPIPAVEFRQALFRNLSAASSKEKLGEYRLKGPYRSKTSRIYFTKRSSLQRPSLKKVVTSSQSNMANLQHQLERMEKRRECCICRYDFRKGSTDGRRRPKLSQFECRSCNPPSALCGGDTACFLRWHHWVTCFTNLNINSYLLATEYRTCHHPRSVKRAIQFLFF